MAEHASCSDGGLPARIKVITTDHLPGVLVREESMTSSTLVAPILFDFIGRKDREHFVTLHFNARNQLMSLEITAIGSLVASLVHPREVFKSAILQNAASVICGHNHPSGDPSPSREDQAIYTRLVRVGKVLGIEVLDFLIVTDSKYVSFTDLGAKEESSAPVQACRLGDFCGRAKGGRP